MADLSGKLIGRYHILTPIGVGGMASVYRARDQRLQRDIAIKFIRSEMFPPAHLNMVLQRFEREAVALARLEHPNIVHVYDIGEHEGAPFVVMEFLSGGTLRQRITGRLPTSQAAAFLAPVARALAYAHAEGIIHRDVKPSNIIFTGRGIPKLSDFGIAKLLEVDEGTQLTGTGMSMGTPAYMAPEQWSGSHTPAVDIYALGAVFYELLSGQLPYQGDTPAELFAKVLTQPLPDIRAAVPGISQVAVDVLTCALARQAERRFPSMENMASALERLAGQGAAPASADRSEPVVAAAAADMPTPPSHPVVDLRTHMDVPAAIVSDRAAPPLPAIEEPYSVPSARKKLPLWMLIAAGALMLMLAAGGILASGAIAPVAAPAATQTLPLTANDTLQPSQAATELPAAVTDPATHTLAPRLTFTLEPTPNAAQTLSARQTLAAKPTATLHSGMKFNVGPTATPTRSRNFLLLPTNTSKPK